MTYRLISLFLIFISLNISSKADEIDSDPVYMIGKCYNSIISIDDQNHPYGCDMASLSIINNDPNHIMLQFSNSKNNNKFIIGYSGIRDGNNSFSINKVFVSNLIKVHISTLESECSFNIKNNKIDSITCNSSSLDNKFKEIINFKYSYTIN